MSSIEEWSHRCIRCGNCKYIFKEYIDSCPSGAHFHFETYFASGRIRLAQGISRGELEWTPDLLDPIFACTTCGNCEQQCLAPHHEHIVEIIEELREKAVDALGALPSHQKFSENIERCHNPYGAEHHARKLKETHGLPDRAEVVYFIGCTSNYRETAIRDATISLLKKAEINFTIVDEYCCTSPLLRTGQKSGTIEIARHNVGQIVHAGASAVVTSCSGCFRTMKIDYPKLGIEYDFKVLHITEFIAQLMAQGRLQLKSSIPHGLYTWHDPCHLGRHSNVYDPPRKVLQEAHIPFVEMASSRENAWCCGAGGGCKSAYGEWSIATASKRISQAQEVGAETIVTGCPFCVRNLRDASEGSKIEIMDIAELIDRLL